MCETLIATGSAPAGCFLASIQEFRHSVEEVPFFSASGDECPLPSKGAAGAGGSGGQVSLRPRVRVSEREGERETH